MSTPGTVYNVVVGWTGPIDIDLKDDGAIPATAMDGTVELILKDAAGTQIDFAGDVSIVDAVNWRVRVSPDPTDFVLGVYRGRIKVTDGNGKVAYFPNSSYDRWICNPEA